jgi:hypothetical protein
MDRVCYRTKRCARVHWGRTWRTGTRILGLVAVSSCARVPDARSTAAGEPAANGGSSPTTTTTPTPSTAASTSATPTGAPSVTASTTATATPTGTDSAKLDGEDFLPEAMTLYRVAACGAAGPVPDRFDPAVIAHHCDDLGRAYDDYKKTWVDVAMPFLASVRPADLPRIVVYPFGGGDLASALATFPEALDFTTISLEPAGDIRPIDTMRGDRLAHELAGHRGRLERLFEKAHSRTDNLEKESQTDLPGEIVFSLAALVVHGFEPVSLRYFRLAADGGIEYVTHEQIEALAHKPKQLHQLFENVEIDFRAMGLGVGGPGDPPASQAGQDGGADGKAAVRALRHIAFNLDDDHIKADGSLLAYLRAKGMVVAMTKAATHLLWNNHFSQIRGWLADNTVWMASDSTGLPPRVAEAAGLAQDTYGRFDGPAAFGTPDNRDGDDLHRLFASEPTRPLAFRYGYPDSHGHAHLVVTYRK